MNYKYICNSLYRHLIHESYQDRILFLSDKEFARPADGRYLSDIEGIICQPFYVQRSLIDRLPGLKWVQITGAGYEQADTAVLKERNIMLTNSRGVMSISIAEDVFAKMLFFSRQIRRIEENKKAGIWDMFGQDQWMCSCYTDLYQKTLGIMGFGSIGKEVAKRAAAFGMHVWAYGIREKKDILIEKCFVGKEQLADFYRGCDYILLSMPLTAQTRYMIGREAFRSMKNTAVLINISRGPVVQTEQLLKALDAGEIYGAALDVFEEEPLSGENILWKNPHLFLTPHKAGMGDSWQVMMGSLLNRNLRHYEQGEKLENEIILYE